jgi:hypothetical protein
MIVFQFPAMSALANALGAEIKIMALKTVIMLLWAVFKTAIVVSAVVTSDALGRDNGNSSDEKSAWMVIEVQRRSSSGE